MKLALVGVGGAGGRIADALLAADAEREGHVCGDDVLAFDTDQASLDALASVPEKRRVLVGDTYPGAESTGVDGDPDLAVDATNEELSEIRRALDGIEVYDADAVVLTAGLGGGTGAGAGSLLLEEFATVYEIPVYAIGALPAAADGDERSLTAARGLQSYVRHADAVLPFDNGSWLGQVDESDADARVADDRSGDDDHTDGAAPHSDNSDSDSANDDGATDGDTDEANTQSGGDGPPLERYGELNDALVERLYEVFVVGGHDRLTVPESEVDVSDVVRTLDVGGVATVGRASVDLGSDGGFLARLRSLFGGSDDEIGPDAVQVTDLVRRAVDTKLTLPCAISSAERAIVVLSGPPEALSRKGFENARYWLGEEADTVEVLAGDDPREGATTLSAVVCLANVADAPAIDAIQRRGLEALPAPESEPVAESESLFE